METQARMTAPLQLNRRRKFTWRATRTTTTMSRRLFASRQRIPTCDPPGATPTWLRLVQRVPARELKYHSHRGTQLEWLRVSSSTAAFELDWSCTIPAGRHWKTIHSAVRVAAT